MFPDKKVFFSPVFLKTMFDLVVEHEHTSRLKIKSSQYVCKMQHLENKSFKIFAEFFTNTIISDFVKHEFLKLHISYN